MDSWRALRSLEGVVLRGLLSSAASPAPSSALLDAVRDVLSSKRRSQLPLASALSLCAFAFASLGPRELPAHEERALRRALLESLSAEDVQQLEEWMAVGGEAGDAQRAERAASGIWAWLERIRYARSALAAPRLADLVEPEEPPVGGHRQHLPLRVRAFAHTTLLPSALCVRAPCRPWLLWLRVSCPWCWILRDLRWSTSSTTAARGRRCTARPQEEQQQQVGEEEEARLWAWVEQAVGPRRCPRS